MVLPMKAQLFRVAAPNLIKTKLVYRMRLKLIKLELLSNTILY